MATKYGEVPYGLTELKIFPLLNGLPDAANGKAVPIGRTLEFTPKEDSTDLTGYNAVVYTNTHNTSADVTLDILALITGGTIVITGTSPNAQKKLEVAKAGVQRPYVAVMGRSLGDDGGDAWVLLGKVKFDIPKGNFKEGEYYITSCTGKAVRTDDQTGNLYEIIQNETAKALDPTGL
jgi:hypothetical protein